MAARPGGSSTLSVGDLAVVAAICFGWFILASIDAVASGWPERPFRDDGLLWIVATELILATVAILFLRLRGFSVGALLPHPTVRGCAVGAVLFVFGLMAAWLVTLPFDDHGSQPVVGMVERAQISALAVVMLALVNGPFEEIFLLGVLSEGLRRFGASIALGVPLLVRTMYHLYQGPVPALGVCAFGLVLGVFYLRYRAVWPAVFAHILGDTVPFVGLTS